MNLGFAHQAINIGSAEDLLGQIRAAKWASVAHRQDPGTSSSVKQSIWKGWANPQPLRYKGRCVIKTLCSYQKHVWIIFNHWTGHAFKSFQSSFWIPHFFLLHCFLTDAQICFQISSTVTASQEENKRPGGFHFVPVLCEASSWWSWHSREIQGSKVRDATTLQFLLATSKTLDASRLFSDKKPVGAWVCAEFQGTPGSHWTCITSSFALWLTG